jgi:hypothetical protein
MRNDLWPHEQLGELRKLMTERELAALETPESVRWLCSDGRDLWIMGIRGRVAAAFGLDLMGSWQRVDKVCGRSLFS